MRRVSSAITDMRKRLIIYNCVLLVSFILIHGLHLPLLLQPQVSGNVIAEQTTASKCYKVANQNHHVLVCLPRANQSHPCMPHIYTIHQGSTAQEINFYRAHTMSTRHISRTGHSAQHAYQIPDPPGHQQNPKPTCYYQADKPHPALRHS